MYSVTCLNCHKKPLTFLMKTLCRQIFSIAESDRLLFSAHISYGKGKYLNQTGFFSTKFAKILFIFKFKGVTHRIQPT